MKAIPTFYKGEEYRSRLEARWGVFFDKMNFPAYYEPFTIKNNGLEYKPDFWCMDVFQNAIPVLFEIKPIKPNIEYIKYLVQIHDPNKSDILVCVGDPNLGQPNGYWIHWVYNKKREKETKVVEGFGCIKCAECGRFTINSFYDISHGMAHTFCERYHNQITGNNRDAAEYAKHYRFDLVTAEL